MIESPEKVALLDMDGTVCDWHGALERDYRALMANASVSLDVEDRIKHLIRRQSGWYRSLRPLPLGLVVVRLLKDIGFRIMVLTKAGKHTPNAWNEKVEWISEHLPDVDVTVTQDKGLVYGRVLVDDYPEHIGRWLEWRPRGVVVMPAQPWNENMPPRENVHRVSTEGDLERVIPALKEAYQR